MTRRSFINAIGASVASGAMSGCMTGRRRLANLDFPSLQKEIDLVKGADFKAYKETGEIRFDAIQRLDEAFDKVVEEIRQTKVGDHPAVWLLYNMGIIVKTRETCFSIDLMHPRAAEEMASLLDFALITHNHSDHYTREFYAAMNDAHKTVINNFECNYGVRNWRKDGGYTRARKTFMIKDVEIKTDLTDHNDYLVDFTSTFEINIGSFRIFHSGDCSNVKKLNPKTSPDLWFVHPRCGMNIVDGVKKFNPRTTVIAHLNELGHDKWRWSWQDGLAEKAKVEAVGGKAIVPQWGERIV